MNKRSGEMNGHLFWGIVNSGLVLISGIAAVIWTPALIPAGLLNIPGAFLNLYIWKTKRALQA